MARRTLFARWVRCVGAPAGLTPSGTAGATRKSTADYYRHQGCTSAGNDKCGSRRPDGGKNTAENEAQTWRGCPPGLDQAQEGGGKLTLDPPLPPRNPADPPEAIPAPPPPPP